MITRSAENFQNYLPVYENRHSPLLYIILSGFKKAGLNFESIRFLYLHVNLITLFLMFKCIKIKYPNLKDFTILFLSISVILLSPNLRTASYWLLPYSLGFFAFQLYFFIIL